MKRIHPSASDPLILAALAISLGAAGCRNQSGGMANPFLAPGRVPPPATRAIMPGQAQPYYPGDPLPVMQSNAAPAAPKTDANGLNWAAPGANSPVAAATARQPEPTVPAEAMVAIPKDDDPLRYPLVAPAEPEPIAPVAASPIQVAQAPQSQAVLQASYTEPVLGAIESQPASPWRTPQIAQPTLPPPPAIQAQPAVQPQPALPPPPMVQAMLPASPVAQPMFAQPTYSAPLAVVPDSMDVSLRAVPSPPPRIRMPSEVVPQTAIQDGFRPRSSMR